MLVELRQKSQITIPREIVASLNLSEGDKLDIYERDGVICLMPVVIYPKQVLNDLSSQIKQLKSSLSDDESTNPQIIALEELLAKLENTR